MMAYPSSNPIHLSKEATAKLADLQYKIKRCAQLGYDDLTWDYRAEMLHIVNCSTVHALSTGNYSSDDVMMFCETPESYEAAKQNNGKKGVHLELLLIEGSELANDILEVLKKHMEKGQTNE